MIALDSVTTAGRARQATRRQVDALVESIREVGLLNPITVCATDHGYALVAGLHRLEACRALGWTEIPAVVLDLDEQQRIIAECDENLCAPTLTATERAEFTRRRKAAYEALHPEAAHGSPSVSRQVGDTRERSEAPRFTADTAARTGQSERVVQRDAERGDKVCDEALALIRNTRLDTGRYLDGIKNLSPEEQVARVNADLVEPVAHLQPAPEPELDPETAKLRREIARLTPDAMVDEIIGLRADLAEAKAKATALKTERDDLKAKLAEATQSDLGRALGNAQRRADAAEGRMKEYQATAKRLEYRLKKAEDRVRELEDTPIQMDAA